MRGTTKSPGDIHSQKAKLEVQKLKLEINELRLSWWKRPAYAIPLTLAVLAFLSVYHSGYFGDQRKEILLQTQDLSRKRDELSKRVSAIDARVKVATSAYKSVIYSVVGSTFKSEVMDIPTTLTPLQGNVLNAKYYPASEICQFDQAEWTIEGEDRGTRFVAVSVLKNIENDLANVVADQQTPRWRTLLHKIILETSNQKYETLNTLLVKYKMQSFDKSKFENRYDLPKDYYQNICVSKALGSIDQTGAMTKRIAEAFAARKAVSLFLGDVLSVLQQEISTMSAQELVSVKI